MKLKLTLLAAMMATAGAANAQIDNGAGGNGGLFANFFTDAVSFSYNLGYTIDSFQTAIAAAGTFDQTFNLGADSNFTSFLAGAGASTINFNLWAVDTSGQRRVITTFADTPAVNTANDRVRTTAGNVQGFVNQINAVTTNGVSQYTSANTAASFGGATGPAGNDTGVNALNFNNAGTYGDTAGVGLRLITAASTGIAASTFTTYADAGSNLVVSANNGVLSLSAVTAAVPEPETLAMLLAGFGLVGSIARRRMNRMNVA
jgi:hypothetical protein